MTTCDERPWLALYDDGVPADPVLPLEHGLEMSDAALRVRPTTPLIHYFDSTLTVTEVDRLSANLAGGSPTTTASVGATGS